MKERKVGPWTSWGVKKRGTDSRGREEGRVQVNEGERKETGKLKGEECRGREMERMGSFLSDNL